MKTKRGFERNGLDETRRKLASIQYKRDQISLTEGLLQTYEQLPEEKRNYDYERYLRAKLRAKKNQLTAMGPL